MRQVRAEASVRVGAGNRRGNLCKRLFRRRACRRSHSRRCTAGCCCAWTQRGEILGAVNVNPQQHLGVLRAAILRALAEINAGLVRIHPHLVDAIRNQVCLSRQAGEPRSCGPCRRKAASRTWASDGRLADRNVQLVRSDDAELRIAKLPPELMADDSHLNSTLEASERPECEWITRAVARNRTTTIRTGITVHASSICVLPYTWAARGRHRRRRRNFTTA